MDNHIAHVRKHTAYHQGLYTERQASLSTNSGCGIELTDADLETVRGGLLAPLQLAPQRGLQRGPQNEGLLDGLSLELPKLLQLPVQGL